MMYDEHDEPFPEWFVFVLTNECIRFIEAPDRKEG